MQRTSLVSNRSDNNTLVLGCPHESLPNVHATLFEGQFDLAIALGSGESACGWNPGLTGVEGQVDLIGHRIFICHKCTVV